MHELIFQVEESPEGGYCARALGESIFTEADDIQSLHHNVREAVRCHYGENDIALHFQTTRDNILEKLLH